MRHVTLTVPRGEGPPDGVYQTLVKHAPHRPASITNFAILDDGSTIELVQVEGEQATIRDKLNESKALRSADIFRSVGQIHQIFQHVAADEALLTILDVLRNHMVIMDLPIRFNTEGVAIRLVGEDESIQTAFIALPESVRTNLRIDRIATSNAESSDVAALLTERQREVLEAAVTAGYYAFPRTSTVEDIASDLGIARSTASEHLRRIEARVLSAAV